MTDDEIPGQLTFDEFAASHARLTRWFRYQAIADEVFAEREAQEAQWGYSLPPLGILVHHLQGLSRDELVQLLAVGVKMIGDVDASRQEHNRAVAHPGMVVVEEPGASQ